MNLRSLAGHMSALLDDIDTINFALNAEKSQVDDAISASIRNGWLVGQE